MFVMGFKNTLRVLQAHTDEINKILEVLESSEEIRTIDLDLILEKLRTVYDVVNDLRKEVQSGKQPEDKTAVEAISNSKDANVVEMSPEKDDITEETKNESSTEQEPVTKNESRIKTDEKKEKREEKEAILSERFKSEDRTLNEEIGGQSKQDDLSSKISTNPIASMTSAIGLNEKFELINELFEGDKDKFEHTMQVLNSSDSFVEAYSYLEEKFEWDMENPYVQRILELIRRKLIVRRNEQ